MKKTAQILLVATLAIAASGCATWDKLSTREKGAAIGAGAGAVLVRPDGYVFGSSPDAVGAAGLLDALEAAVTHPA